jgi:hypothetical protein
VHAVGHLLAPLDTHLGKLQRGRGIGFRAAIAANRTRLESLPAPAAASPAWISAPHRLHHRRHHRRIGDAAGVFR